MAMNSPEAKASHRRRQQRQWTCQLKVEMRTSIRMPMRRVPFPKTASRTQAGNFVLDLIDGGRSAALPPKERRVYAAMCLRRALRRDPLQVIHYLPQACLDITSWID
jgi:hypothetical protein